MLLHGLDPARHLGPDGHLSAGHRSHAATWLTQACQAPAAQRSSALAAWEHAPQARQCHPPQAEEHLLPLMVAAGAAPRGQGRKVFSDRVMQTTLSAFRFD